MHILIECTGFSDTCNKYFVPSSMEECLKPLTFITFLILSKKLYFFYQVMVLLIFIVAVALILSYFDYYSVL